jgi:hypothetical protein
MIDVPAGHFYLGERIEPSSRKRDGRAVLPLAPSPPHRPRRGPIRSPDD